MSLDSRSSAPPGFSRRTLLAASAAGLALLVAGCSSAAGRRRGSRSPARRPTSSPRRWRSRRRSSPRTPRPAPPTRRWPRRWPSWPRQAGEQLDRLQAAAPGADARRPSSSAAGRPPARRRAAWLRGQVAAAADLARHRLRGPVGRAGGAARLDRRGPARPGRTAGMTGAAMADDDGDRRARPSAPRTPRCGEALAAEHAAVWGYGVVGAALGAERAAAGGGRRGGPPRRPRPGRRAAGRAQGRRRSTPRAAYALPFPVLSAVDAAALAVVLEDGVAAAWVRVLDQAAERSTRELAVGVLSAAEVRAVGWRIAAGQTPVTSALPRPARPVEDPVPRPRSSGRLGRGQQGAEERVGDARPRRCWTDRPRPGRRTRCRPAAPPSW